MRHTRPTSTAVLCTVLLVSLSGCGAYTQSFAVQYGDAIVRTFLDLLVTGVVNEIASPAPPPEMPPPTDPCEDVTCGDGEICVDGECIPEPTEGDPVAGMMFYFANGCDVCHGDNAEGGIGPSLIGATAEELFASMSGLVPHAGGVTDGVTPQDAVDVEAWLDELAGGGNPCDGVTCDPGETCVDGDCVPDDPCEGVSCDDGEECVDGECVAVDPCDGVTCDPGEICVDGACVPDDACDGVTCDEGEECVDGACVPVDPCDTEGDADAGMTFYFDNGCNACHGDNGSNGFAPSLADSSCDLLFDNMSGNDPHAGGVVDGVTRQDAADIRAWLDSL